MLYKGFFDQLPQTDLSVYAKYNEGAQQFFFKNKDLLPFWVADMDFHTFPPIQAAIESATARRNYSYQFRTDEQIARIAQWFSRRHAYPRLLPFSGVGSGVLSAIALLVDRYSKPGDGVIIQTPVYHMFLKLIKGLKRQLVQNPLLQDPQGRFEMDLDLLEQQLAKPDTKILLLCHPHNPVGRIWSMEVLEQVVQMAASRGVLVLSDEVHADIALEGSLQSILHLDRTHNDRVVALNSTGKTFGIPGLADAYVFTNHSGLRAEIKSLCNQLFTAGHHTFSLEPIHQALGAGEEWLAELLPYLRSNLAFIQEYLEKEIPVLKPVQPEGTFQLWIDARATGKSPEAIEKVLVEHGKLALAQGHWFGEGGPGWVRMNFATPRTKLEQGLHQLKKAFEYH